MSIAALLVDQVQDAGDCTANDRCDHVDPQVVVHLLGRWIEPIVVIKFVRIDVGVRILAHRERDVAAGERWIKPKTTGILVGSQRDGEENYVERQDLDQSVFGQLRALVLDRDEGEDQDYGEHEDRPESLPVTRPIVINTMLMKAVTGTCETFVIRHRSI